MKKEHLDNLTRGIRPTLHAAPPNWDTLRGLAARARDSLADAKNVSNGLPTRFQAAYSAAFCLARVALEACGYRLGGAEGHRTTVFQSLANTLEWETARWRRMDDLHKFRNRFDYGDVVEVSQPQVEVAIADSEFLLSDVLRHFPQLGPH